MSIALARSVVCVGRSWSSWVASSAVNTPSCSATAPRTGSPTSCRTTRRGSSCCRSTMSTARTTSTPTGSRYASVGDTSAICGDSVTWLDVTWLTDDQRWQWVTLFDPWPTWPISQLTRDPPDPWPATHDYWRVMTPDYCSFQSGPLSGSALKIKHHHCHEIASSWNLVNLIMGQRVTSTDPWPTWPTWPTQICWPAWPVTRDPLTHCHLCRRLIKKVKKVAHTRFPSVGFRSWSRFLAVSLQVTWVINPTVGCHYFPPGLQLPPQPLRWLLPVLLLGEQRHNGSEQFV